MQVTLYHNPRCTKSREALRILRNEGMDVTVIEYLKDPLSAEEIRALSRRLGLDSPRGMMRTKEDIYKERALHTVVDPVALIQAMAEHPVLIERPIAVVGEKAVIGRPPERVLEVTS